jgi:hypothetical protein
MHDLGQVIAVYSISALQLDLGREVAQPAAHKVEDLAACREETPVQLRDRRYGGLVYVRDEPGRPVELLVRRLVGPPKSLPWKPRQLPASLPPLARGS